MRISLFVFAALTVVVLAVWALNENHKTRAVGVRVERLAAEIGNQGEKLNYLKAEWAHLSRPERLATLVERYFDDLKLVPLTYANLISIQKIPTLTEWPKHDSETESLEGGLFASMASRP